MTIQNLFETPFDGPVTRPKVERELVKMSELARRSEVPAATIKHYIREGLLPEPAVRTSPNMAYYDVALIPRIKAIKDLQRSRYLPLKVIKEILEEEQTSKSDEKLVEALGRVLNTPESSRSITHDHATGVGVEKDDLDTLEGAGLVDPEGKGGERVYSGADVDLIEVLFHARKAGFRASDFPAQLAKLYVQALDQLVRFELQLFRQRVLPYAPKDLEDLTGTAVNIGERLVTTLRRRLLIPTLSQLMQEEAEGSVESV